VTTGVWHDLQVRASINGGSGQTEVWLDGVRINALSKPENLGTTLIRRIQVGDNSTGRTFDVAFDNVTVNSSFIDMTPPAVTLEQPAANAMVKEEVTVGAAASDGTAIDRVDDGRRWLGHPDCARGGYRLERHNFGRRGRHPG
jgi:hypothetical protein